MMDVSRTLLAEPLGVSKTWSFHPGQQGGEREKTTGEKGWRRRRKKTLIFLPAHLIA
jgi:hypothetical protein